jgi:hypothetical protein
MSVGGFGRRWERRRFSLPEKQALDLGFTFTRRSSRRSRDPGPNRRQCTLERARVISSIRMPELPVPVETEIDTHRNLPTQLDCPQCHHGVQLVALFLIKTARFSCHTLKEPEHIMNR